MKRIGIYLLSFSVIVLLSSVILQDDLLETLKKKLNTYRSEKPSTALYLHLDKNNYSPGEVIWFKAYVLSGTVTDNKVLNVRLTDKNKKIIISNQFPMYNLLGHGDLALPHSLPDGEYYFYAYTDRMINFSEKDVFVQKIRVHSGSAKRLQVEASVSDTAKLRRGQEVEVKVSLLEDGKLVKNAKGEYRLYAGGNFLKGGKLGTNDFGESSINFTYPQLADDQSLKVSVKFSRDEDYADLSLNLKHEGNPVLLNVYPEGGHLIEGIENRLAVEALDINQNPVSTEVLLKNGEQVVGRTKTNEQGIGIFRLKPTKNQTYTLELPENKKSISSSFPQTETRGYGVRLNKQQDQSIHAVLYNKGEEGNVLLVLRSYEEILWGKQIAIPPGDSISVAVPVTDLPKEVLSLAIFDAAGNPKSERLFLNKQQEEYKLNIQTDEQIYGTRKKVTVNIMVSDQKGNPMETNLSVAAVEKGRVDLSTYRTILHSYRYRFLEGSRSDHFLADMKESDLDALLLSKHWWHSQWPEVTHYIPKGSLKLIKNADGVNGTLEPFYGKIGIRQLTLIKELTLLSNTGVFTVPVAADGSFSIPSASLLINSRIDYWRIFEKKLSETLYKSIKYQDLGFDKQVVMGSSLSIPETFNALAKARPIETANLNGMINLQEVTIKGSVEGISDYWSTTCEDKACIAGTINCERHPNIFEPIQGHIYTLNTGKAVIYSGCANGQSPLKSVFIPRRFTLPDYEKAPRTEPQYRSTIYWNSNLNTDKTGKVSFSFFTSDIKGDFLIMAQGVEINAVEPVYGTGSFSVK